MPDSKVPLSAAVLRAMHEAAHGPNHETLVPCPACKGCDECADLRMVTTVQAAVYREKHPPKGTE